MRILMVTPALPYPEAPNAGSIVMFEQLSRLAHRHDVTLATFAGPEPSERMAVKALENRGIRVRVVWRPHFRGMSLFARRLRVGAFALRDRYRWWRGDLPRYVVQMREPEMQRLLDAILQDRFDIVQVEDSVMASYRFRTRSLLVLTDHEVRVAMPRANDTGKDGDMTFGSIGEQRRWHAYLPPTWRRYDRIQVFTQRDAEALRYLAPRLGSRVIINPFGISTSTRHEAEDKRPNELVFVGGFTHPPNVDAALWLAQEIMPRLQELVPMVRLTLVGSHPPEAVTELASEAVTVTGRVPAVEPYLNRAAVIVAPIRTGGGMRMKVLQAMAAGKAVVTTSLGTEGLHGERRELPIVIADEGPSFAAEVARLLSDPVTRNELGERARRFVLEHHDWDHYVDRLEATYASLLV